jgi:PD-(D/E)XK endonuclease
MTSNRKGAIAELKIAAAATELGIPVLKPMAEHGRYDLAFEIGDRILRVQCKLGGARRRRGCDQGQPPNLPSHPRGLRLRVVHV